MPEPDVPAPPSTRTQAAASNKQQARDKRQEARPSTPPPLEQSTCSIRQPRWLPHCLIAWSIQRHSLPDIVPLVLNHPGTSPSTIFGAFSSRALRLVACPHTPAPSSDTVIRSCSALFACLLSPFPILASLAHTFMTVRIQTCCNFSDTRI